MAKLKTSLTRRTLILSRAAFRARIYHLPVSSRALSAPDLPFGSTCTLCVKKHDPNISLLKTVRNYLTPDLNLSYMTWPQSGMMRNGQPYALTGLAIGTNVQGSLLLPTPCASEAYKGFLTSLGAYQKYFRKKKMQNKLIYQAYLNGLTSTQTRTVFEQMQGFPLDWTKLRSTQLEIALM